jgi:fluoride exporter
VLGGFTTASTLALEVGDLAERPVVALGYLAASLAGGVLAAGAGLRLGERR